MTPIPIPFNSGSALLAILLAASTAATAADTSPRAQLARFETAAGRSGDLARGRQFFTTPQGGDKSCASCHHAVPTTPGRHASTGKPIAPLAPAANAEAFTDTARVDKWFRRNCRDIAGRECSAGEKADLLAFLMSLAP